MDYVIEIWLMVLGHVLCDWDLVDGVGAWIMCLGSG